MLQDEGFDTVIPTIIDLPFMLFCTRKMIVALLFGTWLWRL